MFKNVTQRQLVFLVLVVVSLVILNTSMHKGKGFGNERVAGLWIPIYSDIMFERNMKDFREQQYRADTHKNQTLLNILNAGNTVYDAYESYEDGDYLGAALGMGSLLPGPAGYIATGVGAAYNLANDNTEDAVYGAASGLKGIGDVVELGHFGRNVEDFVETNQ